MRPRRIVRAAASIVIAAAAVAPACSVATESEPTEAVSIDGLWTHLLFRGRPDEPRRLPLVYQGPQLQREELARIATSHAQSKTPLVLDIEKQPGRRDVVWLLAPDRESPERIAEARTYMCSRLAIANDAGATVALWSRPSQNGMSHLWKDTSRQEPLRRVYDARWDACKPVLALQDFVAIQLYAPPGHRRFLGEHWPADEWVSRGHWLHGHAAKRGKRALMFVSPTWGGARTDFVPAEWLEHVVTQLRTDDIPVCVWGGQGKDWDPDHAVCATISRLMAAEYEP